MGIFKKIFDRLETYYYNTYYGIRNLIKWFPVVWKDRDWDEIYFYRINAFKLKQMEKLFESDYCHILDSERYAKQIKIARVAMDRLSANDYDINNYYSNRSDELFGELDWYTTPVPEKKGFRQMHFFRKGVKNKTDENLERVLFKKSSKHTEYLLKQDLNLFCKMVEKHSQKWWD